MKPRSFERGKSPCCSFGRLLDFERFCECLLFRRVPLVLNSSRFCSCLLVFTQVRAVAGFLALPCRSRLTICKKIIAS